jgi:hypothetical protein
VVAVPEWPLGSLVEHRRFAPPSFDVHDNRLVHADQVAAPPTPQLPVHTKQHACSRDPLPRRKAAVRRAETTYDTESRHPGRLAGRHRRRCTDARSSSRVSQKPRRPHWIRSNGGVEKAERHRPAATRPARLRRSEHLPRSSYGATRRFSRTALCGTLATQYRSVRVFARQYSSPSGAGVWSEAHRTLASAHITGAKLPIASHAFL